MTFDGLEYTREALEKQLGLIQLHGTDGSAVEAGCSCIDEKHLLLIEGLSEEGMTLASDAKEKQFYAELADLARNLRKKIDAGDFSIHGIMRETMKAEYPIPHHSDNPGPRGYLPHGLTECEKANPKVRHKLSKCIKKLEPKERAGEIESAVAVCRASVPCP